MPVGEAQVDRGPQDYLAIAKSFVRKDGVGRYEIALVYTGLGNKTEAFKWAGRVFIKRIDAGLSLSQD